MKRALSIIIILIMASTAAGATLDGGTLFVVDTSGSGVGQGVTVATDSAALRAAVMHGLLGQTRIDGAKKLPTVAVVTCGGEPKVLLTPTNDRAAVDSFLKTLRLGAAGPTTISATFSLLRTLPGRPKDIVFITDGLLTDAKRVSADVVRHLPEALAEIYGTAPRIHIVAVDSSRKVFTRVEPAWIAVAEDRVARVHVPGDVRGSVEFTRRNLARSRPPAQPTKQPASRRRSILIPGVVAAAFVAVVAALKLRSGRSSLNALITIEENGCSRRTSARTFGKQQVSIGDGACDVKVPKWEKPITLLEREVVDRRGRKRRQTIARHGNRSVILGAIPVSFSNGTTTVRLRGGRR